MGNTITMFNGVVESTIVLEFLKQPLQFGKSEMLRYLVRTHRVMAALT